MKSLITMLVTNPDGTVEVTRIRVSNDGSRMIVMLPDGSVERNVDAPAPFFQVYADLVGQITGWLQ